LIDRSGDVGHHPRPKHFGFPLNLPPIESEIVDAVFQSEKSIRGELVERWKLRYFNSFEFFDHTGYTESPGAPWLCEVLVTIYAQIKVDQLIMVSAAEEAIFLFYHALLTPQDHAIVETPCYESALTVPKSTGAAVSEWRRKSENGWAHDLQGLEALIRPSTRALYINTPHNPTGLLMRPEIFRGVLELAAWHGIYVFCDEVYRELEHDPATRLSAGCDLYERAISLTSVSKTYGLPGLRLAWLACRDTGLLQKIVSLKHYTTICASAPSEFLTALAFRHRQKFIDCNLQIVLRNLSQLSAFFSRHADRFSWTPPNASTIGFARLLPQQDVQAFCEKLPVPKSFANPTSRRRTICSVNSYAV
jgi:aspartate/methionine/tyrosine aminotransferase